MRFMQTSLSNLAGQIAKKIHEKIESVTNV